MVRLSSQLLLPNHESYVGVLQPRMDESTRFGLIPVRSPLLRESRLISSPAGTEMFHFPALASCSLCIQLPDDEKSSGFPIQKSSDQRMFGSSPRLIAACHVFLRLSAPRHPPVALINLFSLELPSLSLFNCKRTTTTFRRCRTQSGSILRILRKTSRTKSSCRGNKPNLVEVEGIEPTTSSLQSWRSPN